MNLPFPIRSVDVLHIDDDADVREIIGTAVGSDSIFTVRSCASGEEALAATANWSPDLILLDLNMPGMDGPTTLARLHKQPQTAGVPVIYVTAAAKAKGLEDLRSPGVAGIIVKPFDPTTLCSQINAILCRCHRKLENSNRELERKAAIGLAIVESSEDAIVAKDLDGTILSWNAGAERLLGFTADDVVGRNIRSFIPADQLTEEDFILDQVKKGKTLDHFETRRPRKDGDLIDVSLKVSPIRDRAGKVISCMVIERDISQQKRVEAALDTTERRLALAIQGMSVGVWDWNIADDEQYWSDRFKDILGLPAEFPSKYCEFESRLHPDDHDRVIAALFAHLERKTPYDIEFRLRKADGGYVWIHAMGQAAWDADGKPLRMAGSVDDISGRKRAEERFRQVVEFAPTAMVMIGKSGHIVLVNRQTEKLFGYTSSELLGQKIELLMPAAERSQHQGRIDHYFVSPAVLDSSERAMGAGRELYGLRKDGSEFPVEIGLTPIHTDDGVVVLGAVVDITLRKQAAEERHQFSQRLEQQVAQRTAQLEAVNKQLDDFAYAASHDLKAPLRVIDNASKWLEEDLAPHLNDETRENMRLLRGRVTRMEKLLNDLLQFSRIGRETGGTEIISARFVIDDVLAMLPRPDGFEVKVGPGFAAIRVARMPLQQILMNLIGNAIKHHDKTTGRIEVAAADLGSHYAFAVKDDGPGIPAQFHGKIFKMFQTLKPRDQVEGSGMGLAIVRKQIDLSGGSLSLQSSEGKGSTFHFTLPAPQRAQEQH
jgi:PAS domain S-box-containing protein